MRNELTIKNDDLLAVVEEKSLGEIIKPLVNEIYLFDTVIAGTSYIKDPSVYDALEVNEKLSLQREDNKFDSNAIMILYEGNRKLGYVPEKDNIIFARLMDAGKLLKAKITKIEKKGSFKQINVGIYLVDF